MPKVTQSLDTIPIQLPIQYNKKSSWDLKPATQTIEPTNRQRNTKQAENKPVETGK